jgi:hypothetical protein
VVDIKEVRVRNKSPWRNGAKNVGALVKSMKKERKLKLLPKDIRIVSDA